MSKFPIFDEMYGLSEGSFVYSSSEENAERRIPYNQFANWLDKQNLFNLMKICFNAIKSSEFNKKIKIKY